MVGHGGGLISGEATPLYEEDEPLDDSSLPVPVDMEDRHAYDARRIRMPRFRPPSFVTGGGSPGSLRKTTNPSGPNSAQQTTTYQSTIKEHRFGAST